MFPTKATDKFKWLRNRASLAAGLHNNNGGVKG
jgi:hypothetical protein